MNDLNSREEQLPAPAGRDTTAPSPVFVPAPPTNGAAIAALILTFLVPPVAIILGHIARRQIKHSGESGRSMATAALIVSYIFTVTPAIVALVLLIAVSVTHR